MFRLFRIFCIPVLLILAAVLPASAEHILVLQSSNLIPYRQATAGLLRQLDRIPPPPGSKRILPFGVSQRLLSDMPPAAVGQILQADHASLILAIGRAALEAAIRHTKAPVVFLLAPEAEQLINDSGSRQRVTGVLLEIPPGRQLAIFQRLLPGRSFGAIYQAASLERGMEEAQRQAAKQDIDLRVIRLHDPRQAPASFRQLAAATDVLWLLPDPAVLRPQTLTYLFTLSAERRIPVAAFSSALLKKGAAVALAVDPQDIGAQAAELTAKILHGAPPASLPLEPPRKVEPRINRAVARMLGLDLDQPSPRTERR